MAKNKYNFKIINQKKDINFFRYNNISNNNQKNKIKGMEKYKRCSQEKMGLAL